MKRLNLRYHHLMCCYTFKGVGYNEAFSQNMKQVVSMLGASEELELHLCGKCDDLCARCPHNRGGQCDTEESVCARDREVAAFFGLKDRKMLLLSEYRNIILPKQKRLGSIDEVCRECTFTALCQQVLTEKNKI